MRKTMLALVVISLAALLAACELNIYTPPSFDEEVNADTWTGSTLAGASQTDTVTLGPGETFRYKVVLPNVGLEAVYYMLDTELDLTLLDRFNDPVASSASTDFFTSGTLALSSASEAALEPADVTAQLSCLGSCVIERRSGSPRYVRIRNPTGSTVTTDFYAILRDFEDSNEATAPAPLGTGTTDGALETLGDVDRYEVVQAGDVELVFGTVASNLDYRLRIYSAGGTLIDTLFPGDPPVEVLAGEEVRVDATNGADRAGASGKSRYRIALN